MHNLLDTRRARGFLCTYVTSSARSMFEDEFSCISRKVMNICAASSCFSTYAQGIVHELPKLAILVLRGRFNVSTIITSSISLPSNGVRRPTHREGYDRRVISEHRAFRTVFGTASRPRSPCMDQEHTEIWTIILRLLADIHCC